MSRPLAPLAEAALQHGRQAPRGTERCAWLCCSVILATTSTPAAARRALAEITSPELRARARQLLEGLLGGEAER